MYVITFQLNTDFSQDNYCENNLRHVFNYNVESAQKIL